MIRAYFQDARPTGFFRGLFQSPAENFFNSESVELDIVRGDEQVAIAVQDLTAGYRKNSVDVYTNKEFVPPVFKESFGLTSNDLLKRQAGSNPFADFTYRAHIVKQMMRGMRKQEEKIERANELQASQVMQTGTATLTDSAGNSVYSISYSPKATHFPTVGTAWDAGGDIIGDLLSITNVIRNDGLDDPRITIWGEGAYEAALGNADFLARFESRRADLGAISPMITGGTSGANFRGFVDLGNFKIEIWTYGARYVHPQTGVKTQYMDPKKVIVMTEAPRLDALFGAVPHIGRELGLGGQSIADKLGLPGRFGSSGAGMDMFSNAWLSEGGDQLFGGVASRPLFAPTAIDRFGCIDSDIA